MKVADVVELPDGLRAELEVVGVKADDVDEAEDVAVLELCDTEEAVEAPVESSLEEDPTLDKVELSEPDVLVLVEHPSPSHTMEHKPPKQEVEV